MDNQPLQAVGPDGLTLDNLTRGILMNSLLRRAVTGRRKSIEFGGAPSLTVYLSSNRNVGTMVVVTGTDGAQSIA